MKKLALLLALIILIAPLSVFADTYVVETAVLQSPGTSQSDWSAIALKVADIPFDEDSYITQLKNYVIQKYQSPSKLSSSKATEWHRIAIVVNLLGYDATDFGGINLINDGVYYRENLGRQGLNGYIWGLIAVSSGNYKEPSDALNTKESIISTILSKQNPDGSFSLSGNTPSCDITAMAVYALSFYKDRAEVKTVIDNALGYLSSVQNPDGSFSDSGIKNAESTAQVIIALSALGIDVTADTRFPNIYNALSLFKADGGFCHIEGGEADIIASYQALCAIAATNVRGQIYSNLQAPFDLPSELPTQKLLTITPQEPKTELPTAIEEEKTEIETVIFEPTEEPTQATMNDDISNNTYLLIIIPFVFIAFYGIIRFKRKSIIPILVLAYAVLLVTNSQNIADYYTTLINDGDIPVTISIDCKTVLDNYKLLDDSLKNTNYVPSDGVILPQTTVYINDGDTVLDVLKRVTKEHKIQLEYTQSPNDSYVEGINYIYEFSCGKLSGWMYKVNGVFANKGCSSYVLNEGDIIQWVYTCDLGKDVGEDYR